MKNRMLALSLFLVQCIGATFYAIFSSAYMLALPSNNLLHGEPIYKLALSITGGAFLLSIIATITIARFTSKK